MAASVGRRKSLELTQLVYDLGAPWSSPATSARFVQLQPDAPTRDFLLRARTSDRLSWVSAAGHAVLRALNYSVFDANGILDTYPLHLASTGQLQTLFSAAFSAAGAPPRRSDRPLFGTALDIGAGVGLVTQQLQPLVCKPIVTTETSSHMARRLRSKHGDQPGWECWAEDVATSDARTKHASKFDLISMLNVLDRSPRPRELLAAAYDMLQPGGWLLLATPLPFRAFYYEGAQAVRPHPSQELSLRPPSPEALARSHRRMSSSPMQQQQQQQQQQQDGSKEEEGPCAWAEQAEQLMAEVLPAAGLEAVVFGRLPYLSSGDLDSLNWVLDDVIIVARKSARPC